MTGYKVKNKNMMNASQSGYSGQTSSGYDTGDIVNNQKAPIYSKRNDSVDKGINFRDELEYD